jgi:hypothetical protein
LEDDEVPPQPKPKADDPPADQFAAEMPKRNAAHVDDPMGE